MNSCIRKIRERKILKDLSPVAHEDEVEIT